MCMYFDATYTTICIYIVILTYNMYAVCAALETHPTHVLWSVGPLFLKHVPLSLEAATSGSNTCVTVPQVPLLLERDPTHSCVS